MYLVRSRFIYATNVLDVYGFIGVGVIITIFLKLLQHYCTTNLYRCLVKARVAHLKVIVIDGIIITHKIIFTNFARSIMSVFKIQCCELEEHF